MKTKILLSVLAVTLLSSCFGPRFMYNVGLSNVEAPADAQKQYGETKIVTLEEEGKSGHKYEDDYIDIFWFVGSSQFSFNLKNKSEYSIKIPWDDVTYINTVGSVGRVMHSGVKYIDRNNSQPTSVIPKGASLSDIILPTDNVYYVSGQVAGVLQIYSTSILIKQIWRYLKLHTLVRQCAFFFQYLFKMFAMNMYLSSKLMIYKP